MTIIKKFIFLLVVMSFMECQAATKFGYIAYSTSNIGDDIQAIAAMRFLPVDSVPVDREFISQCHYPDQLNTLVNGWFMHSKDCCWWNKNPPPEVSWPPSSQINPLLISIHFTSDFFDKVLTEEGIQYLKEHGPVGARDRYTASELEKRGVPAYFSGCLTLTLQRTSKVRRNVIYAVDISQDCLNYIKSKTKARVETVGHGVPLNIYYSNEGRIAYAKSLLKKYQEAKCVVTTRLHVALPCLAFGTPVLLLANTEIDRFSGLAELTHHTSEKKLLSGKSGFDFNSPPPNPQDYLELRKNLITKVQAWVQQQSI